MEWASTAVSDRLLRKSVFKSNILKDSLLISFLILLISLIFIIALYILLPEFRSGFFSGVYVEFTGMVFDIIVFGILLTFYGRYKNRHDEISRQVEIIDDFKKWGSTEAKFRIAGAIRRINKAGITAIDFRGIELSDFEFKNHDIIELDGSMFSNPFSSSHSTVLERIDFSNISCRGVTFGSEIYSSTRIIDCRFNDVDLTSSSFNNIFINYDIESIVENKHEWDKNTGALKPLPVYRPPFDGAELSDVTFVGTSLDNIDFRGAKNINKATFINCLGIKTCFFDDDIDVDKINKKSQRKKAYGKIVKEYSESRNVS